MRRGFVITIISVSLIMILVLFVLSLRNAQLSTERALLEPLPLTYGAFLLDNIATEFNALVGPQISIGQSTGHSSIEIRDVIQKHNYSAEISNYAAFIESEVAGRTASNITTDFSNLTKGSVTLSINGDYLYTNNHSATSVVFTKEGGTGATSYAIEISTTAIRTGAVHPTFNDTGSLNLSVSYTDINGTVIATGQVDPEQLNSLTVDYADGSRLTMDVGLVDGNPGSLRIKTTGLRAETWFLIGLPPINPDDMKGFQYDASLTYVQGPVRISRSLGK